MLKESTESRAGQAFEPAVVERDMQRLYGRGDFKSVNYSFAAEDGAGYVLTADVAEKS
ncbi:hypothetical protein [uncultured Ramlibacter sp.]|uniref:hypothetical protein n=1 Tax=uncultured Ramlibacter sp. TaxID=260755 RepID=UPI00345BA034